MNKDSKNNNRNTNSKSLRINNLEHKVNGNVTETSNTQMMICWLPHVLPSPKMWVKNLTILICIIIIKYIGVEFTI